MVPIPRGEGRGPANYPPQIVLAARSRSELSREEQLMLAVSAKASSVSFYRHCLPQHAPRTRAAAMRRSSAFQVARLPAVLVNGHIRGAGHVVSVWQAVDGDLHY